MTEPARQRLMDIWRRHIASGLGGVEHLHTFDRWNRPCHSGCHLEWKEREVACIQERAGGGVPAGRCPTRGRDKRLRAMAVNLVAEGYQAVTNHDIVWTIDGADAFEGAALQRTFSGKKGRTKWFPNLQVSRRSAAPTRPNRRSGAPLACGRHCPVVERSLRRHSRGLDGQQPLCRRGHLGLG